LTIKELAGRILVALPHILGASLHTDERLLDQADARGQLAFGTESSDRGGRLSS
jgi:hypothetical protein